MSKFSSFIDKWRKPLIIAGVGIGIAIIARCLPLTITIPCVVSFVGGAVAQWAWGYKGIE